MKKIYAVWYDNGESYEDHQHSICKDDIYFDKATADRRAAELEKDALGDPDIDDYYINPYATPTWRVIEFTVK